MSVLVTATVAALSVFIFWIGAIKILFIPLSAIFELQAAHRRRRQAKTPKREEPLVSIIVPGYNEDRVVVSCVQSIVAANYENYELILVNDGSTDSTADTMRELARTYPKTIFVDQPNSGKGAALNTGTAYSNGRFIMYVDSDGVFGKDTINEMLRPFENRKVGAVSGDDRPVNLDRVLTKLLSLISHVGTGFIRRALSVIDCLPVVSGNIGMFRREALEKAGALRTDTLGEDLELTWRMHRAGYTVKFAPRAVVYAESPSTLRGLWRQRVRWARGMLQATLIHKDMIGNPRYGAFGIYLLFNTLSMIVVPLAQIIVLIGLPVVFVIQPDDLPHDFIGWISLIGLSLALIVLLYSIALNKAWKDLRYFWVFPLWPIYATVMGFALGWAVILEIRGAEKNWNKLERTGTISIEGLSVEKQERSEA